MIRDIAPAKINLFLHVGPVRRDGLHDLESLFVFADAGDLVEASPSEQLTLEISGPFAGSLKTEPVERNLVLRAARRLQNEAGINSGAALSLNKRLPVAAGIGGGSADAAAALRALIRLWRIDISPNELRRLAFSLGADVPACLSREPVRVSGAGEILTPGPQLPPLWVCLANPGVATLTGPIFRAFDATNPAPNRPVSPKLEGSGYQRVTSLMENSRNDLQPIAIAGEPVIQKVINRLAGLPGALAARMSGSGATAFGLYSSAGAAQRAAQDMKGRGWWSMAARICTVAPAQQCVEC